METEKHIVQKKTNYRNAITWTKGKTCKKHVSLPPESPLHESFPVAAAQIILSVIVNFS